MDKEWEDAINEEYGTDFNADYEEDDDKDDEELDGEDKSTQDDTKDDDKGDEDKDDLNDEDEDGGGDDEDESEEDRIAREAKEAEEAAAAKDGEEEKFATKDDIKAALRELDTEKKTYEADHKGMQAEVLEKLFPEGIDHVLRDSDGDPINGIDDLMELVNPKTGELFTDEEAGRWLLESQQKLNRDIEQLEAYASEIVDTNISLKDGSDRVNELYGDLLASVPEVADKLLEAYAKTLVRDPNTGIVTKAPVDVVEFYSIALAPYKEMSQQMIDKKSADDKAAADAAKKAEEDKKKQEKTNQREREDLKPKGKSKLPKSEDEEGWDATMEEYFNS